MSKSRKKLYELLTRSCQKMFPVLERSNKGGTNRVNNQSEFKNKNKKLSFKITSLSYVVIVSMTRNVSSRYGIRDLGFIVGSPSSRHHKYG